MFLALADSPVMGSPQADIPTATYEPKPLPVKQPDRSRQFVNLMLARNRRTLVDAYSAFGQRDAKWDANAIALLEGLAQAMSEQPNAPSSAVMLNLADACLASGCKDPLVIYGRSYCLDSLGRGAEAEDGFRYALEEFEAREAYPFLRMAYAPLRLARLEFKRNRQHTETTDRLYALHIRWLAESIRRSETQPAEMRVLLQQLTSSMDEWARWGYPPDQFQQALVEQTQDSGNSAIWVRNLILADYHVTIGWNARGTGYADSVTDKGWEEFRQHISAAALLLREAHALHPEFPDAARRMITVAKAGGTPNSEPARFWFDRAVAADFTDLASYQAYALDLQPRWNGSLRQLLDFGRECLATERYDTPVPGSYMNILDMIGVELPNPGNLFKTPRIYADTQKLMARVFENKRVNSEWMQSRFACAAYWAGDPKTARRYAEALGPRWERYMGQDNPFAVPKDKMIDELGLAPEIFEAKPQNPPRFATAFEYSAPESTNVSLIGTFNDWDPSRHPMTKDKDGIWRVTLQLPAFMYGYQFLVDGVTHLDPAVKETLQQENGPLGSLRNVTSTSMPNTMKTDNSNIAITIITNYSK